jgi:hypothetical protein
MSEFEKEALKEIPPEILNSMSRELNTTAEGFVTPLEAIMAARKKTAEPKPIESKPIGVVSPQAKPKVVVIDGHAIEVPIDDPYHSFYAMMAYYFATIGYKDKKINKILKAFKFNFRDVNGELIYPVEKKK